MKLARNEKYFCSITQYDTIITQTGTRISHDGVEKRTAKFSTKTIG